jgi:hypothetical protein
VVYDLLADGLVVRGKAHLLGAQSGYGQSGGGEIGLTARDHRQDVAKTVCRFHMQDYAQAVRKCAGEVVFEASWAVRPFVIGRRAVTCEYHELAGALHGIELVVYRGIAAAAQQPG